MNFYDSLIEAARRYERENSFNATIVKPPKEGELPEVGDTLRVLSVDGDIVKVVPVRYSD